MTARWGASESAGSNRRWLDGHRRTNHVQLLLEVAEGSGGAGAGDVVDGGGGLWIAGGAVGGFLQRPADQVAGAQADGEREGEDDATEEDSEGKFDHYATDFEVVEDHGGGEDEDQPFDAEREEARVVELLVDRSDEDRAGQEARDDGAGDEDENRSARVGEVGDEDGGELRAA